MTSKKTDIDLFYGQFLKRSVGKIISYLNLDAKQFDNILQNATFTENPSGHNNKICLANFFTNEKGYLGGICFKYPPDKGMRPKLMMEAEILKILYRKEKNICPKILDLNTLEQDGTPYIAMEVARGNPITHSKLGKEELENVLEMIITHESILVDNIEKLNYPAITKNFYEKIDFEKKASELIIKFIPNLTLKNSLAFLNHYLNSEYIISKRKIVTDRSAGNIFRDQKKNITLIDFSTIRTGTQFDNWIQFIDDPRANFSCSKKDLIAMFFERNKLNIENLKIFYTASIYTNLLQGIFTYEKNPKLAKAYLEKANESFSKLNNKRGILISINY